MTRVSPDLKEMIEATAIDSVDRFLVAGSVIEVPPNVGKDGALNSLLASALYRHMYCRPSPQPMARVIDRRAARVFVEELSSANCGTGSWEPGWRIETIEPDGTLVVANQRDDLTLWAHPEQFSSANAPLGVGSIGRLHVGKELREMLPGYYTALGNADQSVADDGTSVETLRLYWHLTAEIAATWMRELTHRLNAANVAFRAKVLSVPVAYFRADAGVLYLARSDFGRTERLLPELHRTVARHLRPATPMFTKRLARGLAVAEDPGDGRSFGQHRCELVAEGLVRAFERGRTSAAARTDAVAQRFAEEGLDVTKPWLNSGSGQLYGWPSRRASANSGSR
jgi:class II lanthipeptide synthase